MIHWENSAVICGLTPEEISELRECNPDGMKLEHDWLLEHVPDLPSRRKLQLRLLLDEYPAAEEKYKELGWPPDLLRAGVRDVAIWSAHHRENFGCVGIQWRLVGWCREIFAGKVLRIGRLQCNSEHYFEGVTIPNQLSHGDPVINLHIPADGPLDVNACRDSLRLMMAFFAKYRPEYPYRAAVCYSWLLDPVLAKLLPPESNIVRFQRWGHFFPCEESSETIWRVFGERGMRDGVDSVPHRSRMQKVLAEYVRSGGTFGSGGWYLLKQEMPDGLA